MMPLVHSPPQVQLIQSSHHWARPRAADAYEGFANSSCTCLCSALLVMQRVWVQRAGKSDPHCATVALCEGHAQKAHWRLCQRRLCDEHTHRRRKQRGQKLARRATRSVNVKAPLADVHAAPPWLRQHLPDMPKSDLLPGDMAESSWKATMAESFFKATTEKGFSLYPEQEEAILEVFDNDHIILSTPTGSGKSLVAMAMLFRAAAEGSRVYYTCPIKALVSEKFFDLCHAFGPELVGMATGDVSINTSAVIICCTAEVLANIALRDGPAAALKYAVMDEFHYYSDLSRGWAWEIPLLRLPQVKFLLMSATMGDNSGLYATLEGLTGRSVRVVSSTRRPVPLDWLYRPLTVMEAITELAREDKVPVYAVCFTQHDAAALARALGSSQSLAFSGVQKEEMRLAIKDMRFDTPYGPRIREFLLNGIGLHHAGLLPKYRLLTEQLAQSGKLVCICGTDTLGVGVNVPIRSVLFTQLCKFNGEDTVILRARDFHQIAGRAGRRGFDTQGSVVAIPPEHVVANLKLKDRMKKESPARRAKLSKRMQAAPKDRFKSWDESTFRELSGSSPEPLQSRFQLTQGAVLSVLQGAQDHDRDGTQELEDLIASAQCSKASREQWPEQVELYIAALRKAGLLRQEGEALRVDQDLQQDFLLMEDASLFLVDILPFLQWQCDSDSEYAREVLSCIEAVCENPKAVLKAQAWRARGKGSRQGRRSTRSQSAASDIPKYKPSPVSEFVTEAFNGFVKTHPWVPKDSLQPKAIALEMYDSNLSFSDYVLQMNKHDNRNTVVRQEGLLLRYLAQVHKAFRHNIPEEFKTDGLLEIEAFLLATINATDSSLTQEWESLKSLEGFEPGTATSTPQPPGDMADGQHSQDIATLRPETALQERALKARVRVEATRLARLLERGHWDDAALQLRPGPNGPAWDGEQLKLAVASQGWRLSAAPAALDIQLQETETGWRVHVGPQASGGSREAGLAFEAFAPWPRNSFEPLFELRDLRWARVVVA